MKSYTQGGFPSCVQSLSAGQSINRQFLDIVGGFVCLQHPDSSVSCSFLDYVNGLVCLQDPGARCSSVVRAFAHGAMGHRIDPSWGEPIELFLVPASAPQL